MQGSETRVWGFGFSGLSIYRYVYIYIYIFFLGGGDMFIKMHADEHEP